MKIAYGIGTTEPAMMRLHPDAVTALVALGRIDEAERLTAELDDEQPEARPAVGHGDGRSVPRPARTPRPVTWPAATASLEQALVDHERLPMPFETARTRLLFGTVLRRTGHRIGRPT